MSKAVTQAILSVNEQLVENIKFTPEAVLLRFHSY